MIIAHMFNRIYSVISIPMNKFISWYEIKVWNPMVKRWYITITVPWIIILVLHYLTV